MLISNRKLMITSFFTLALTACGGGGGSESTPSTPVTPPAANLAPTVSAGEDQSIYTGTKVILSGEASDTDGTIVSYQWQLTDYASGSAALTLNDADKATAYFETNFNVPEEQAFTFTLTVTDDDGATSSDKVTIKIAPTEFTYVDIPLPENINQAHVLQLDDNQLLVTGGCKAIYSNGSCAEGHHSPKAFLLNLLDNSLTQIADLKHNFYGQSRAYHSKNILPDGRVLSCYFRGDSPDHDYGCEIYDPNSQSFYVVDKPTLTREHIMPVVMDNGDVIVFGGWSGATYAAYYDGLGFFETDTIELFSAETETWQMLDIILPVHTGSVITTRLASNQVLLVGGTTNNGAKVLNTAYIYDHSDRSLRELPRLSQPATNAGGHTFQRLDNDDNICLISGSATYDHLIYDIAFEETRQADVSECNTFDEYNVIQRNALSEVAISLGKGANVVKTPEKIWIDQQINDSATTYDADCDCYVYDEPMIIRVSQVKP